MSFPKDFIWGVATASYQIEGAALEDGRGECIWTRYSHTPGRVYNGDTGDVACDHYHRYKEDVALLKDLGVQAYRFSVSWPRVLPYGTGTVNEPGIDFYDRLVDELLRNGIRPFVTLYHWDLPQALQDRDGGWENPDSPQWFADYTQLITKALGDRVKDWITFNEPWCTAFLGNMIGRHAPGNQDPKKAFRVNHHLMISHGLAMGIIRENVPDSHAGITLNLTPHEPATDHPNDIYAAKRADVLHNDWYLDVIYKGEYPAWGVNEFADALEGLDLSAVKVAAAPTDFLGINYYMRWIHAHNPDNPKENHMVFLPGAKLTHMGWEIYPQGQKDLLLRVHRDYHPAAIYITENGAAFPEPDTVNGDLLEDPDRVAFLKGYFEATEEAIAEGAPVKGYFVWSFMDNFEWGYGYSKRFGVYHIDYKTQKRTPKRSALYLKQVATTGQP